MPTPRTGPHIATLVFMTACTTVTLNLFVPSLPGIAAEFDVPYGTATLAIGGYLAVTAVLALIVGPLSDRIGRRPTALGSIAIFTAASLGCALADSWGMFLTCRLMQASVVSGHVLANAIVRDTRDKDEAASVLGYIVSAMAIAPLLAPVVGGSLDIYLGWRANFWVYALLGALLFALLALDLGETRIRREAEPTRLVSLLAEPAFWAFALTTAISTCGYYAFLAGVPIVALAAYDLTGSELGIGLGSITVGFMAGSFLAGHLTKRFGVNRLVVAGRVVASVGLFAGLAVLALSEPQSALFLFATTIFIGIGNGLTVPPSNAGAMSVKPEFSGSASGFVGSLTVGMGAVVTTLAGVIVTKSATPATLVGMLLALVLASLVSGIAAARLSRA